MYIYYNLICLRILLIWYFINLLLQSFIFFLLLNIKFLLPCFITNLIINTLISNTSTVTLCIIINLIGNRTCYFTLGCSDFIEECLLLIYDFIIIYRSIICVSLLGTYISISFTWFLVKYLLLINSRTFLTYLLYPIFLLALLILL